jgi:hypothetical protein
MYEALTLPSAFPPCGHDVNKAYRTHPEDLSAQNVDLFVPAVCECRLRYIERQSQDDPHATEGTPMDLGIVAAIAMLVVWGAATVFFDAPGWVHLLLTAGVFLLVWRVTARSKVRGGRVKNGR